MKNNKRAISFTTASIYFFTALAHMQSQEAYCRKLLAWYHAHGIYRDKLLGGAKMGEWATFCLALSRKSSTADSYSGVEQAHTKALRS